MSPDELAAPPAEVLDRYFPGDATAKINQYVDLLMTAGIERGLLGPRESGRLWDRHVLNCAVIAPVFDREQAVCDLGSGAGLPGLVLAIARPDLRLTLLEPLLRRATFLREAVDALALEQVDVVRGRAEDVVGTVSVDVVTARAVAPLERLAGWALPLVRPGGELVAMKGQGAADEIASARRRLGRLGAGQIRLETYGEGVVEPPTQVVRIESRR